MPTEHATPEMTLTREIDYERMRSLSKASALLDVAVMRFAAEATRPLIGVHPGSLGQQLAFKGQQLDSGDGVVLAMVPFTFGAFASDGAEVCRVEGALMVVYKLGPDEDGSPFSPDRVEEFAEVTSMYHAWAYIRELVSSSAAKVGLAGVVLPVWTPPRAFPPRGEDTVLRFTPTTDVGPSAEVGAPVEKASKTSRKKRLGG